METVQLSTTRSTSLEETIDIIIELNTSTEVWKALKDTYIQDSIKHELNLIHDLAVIQKGTDSLHEYLNILSIYMIIWLQ